MAALVDLRTKNLKFFTTIFTGFLVKAQGKESQDRCHVSDGYYQKLEAKGSHMATVLFVLGIGRISNSWSVNIFLFWDQNQERSGIVEKRYDICRKDITVTGPSCVARNPRKFIYNVGNLLEPLESVLYSRKHVVPTEWQVRTVLGDCVSKAKVVSIQAPQYRQHALISDFLDLANLSIREEAALAKNLIKDRPEGLKLQNLAFATMTSPVMSSLPKI